MTWSLIDLDLALLDSVKRGDTEAVAHLLDAGADANATDLVEGLSAFQLAQRQGQGVLVGLLLRFRAQPPSNGYTPPLLPVTTLAAPPPPPPERKPEAEPKWLAPLADCYRACGYIRRPRRGLPDPGDEYWEVRFLIRGKRELESLQRLLVQADFKHGPPVRRFGQQMQAIPGRAAVERFHALVARRCGERGSG